VAIKLSIQSLENAFLNAERNLDQGLITFGRSPNSSVELCHNEVSRHHFIIKYINNAYVLIDQNSRHGTLCDGQEVKHGEAFILGKKHIINVPGFIINLVNDEKEPHSEKTVIMARKFMGDSLYSNKHDYEPFLLENSNKTKFYFNLMQSNFVLGSSEHCDFKIESETLGVKEYLSFVRDVNGISVFALNESEVLLNNKTLQEISILQHKDSIKIGEKELVFYAVDDQEENIDKSEKPVPAPAQIKLKHERPVIKAAKLSKFDRVFIAFFVLVLLSTSYFALSF
jgi:pSer/pThr/pTyr-binding forkhead associated (FHA) protein